MSGQAAQPAWSGQAGGSLPRHRPRHAEEHALPLALHAPADGRAGGALVQVARPSPDEDRDSEEQADVHKRLVVIQPQVLLHLFTLLAPIISSPLPLPFLLLLLSLFLAPSSSLPPPPPLPLPRPFLLLLSLFLAPSSSSSSPSSSPLPLRSLCSSPAASASPKEVQSFLRPPEPLMQPAAGVRGLLALRRVRESGRGRENLKQGDEHPQLPRQHLHAQRLAVQHLT
eukprot:767936-Hanusia_phi.AAC.4